MGEEIVMSLKRMDKIMGFDPVQGVVTAEAGACCAPVCVCDVRAARGCVVCGVRAVLCALLC